MGEDPYEGVAPLLDLVSWLAQSAGANVPLELAAHELRWRGTGDFRIYRTGHEIEGVGIVMPGGDWFLEARGSPAATFLANAAAIHGRRPATLTTTERVGALIRPLLSDKGAIGREHKYRTLRCTKPLAAKEGRWATSADVPSLKKYEEQIDRDRRKFMDTSWEVYRAKRAPVFARHRCRCGIDQTLRTTPSFAGIADLFVLPQARPARLHPAHWLRGGGNPGSTQGRFRHCRRIRFSHT